MEPPEKMCGFGLIDLWSLKAQPGGWTRECMAELDKWWLKWTPLKDIVRSDQAGQIINIKQTINGLSPW